MLRRLLRRLRLRRRLLPPLPERSVVPALAGATRVNFAIRFASCLLEPRLPYEPYDAAGRLGLRQRPVRVLSYLRACKDTDAQRLAEHRASTGPELRTCFAE